MARFRHEWKHEIDFGDCAQRFGGFPGGMPQESARTQADGTAVLAAGSVLVLGVGLVIALKLKRR